ncbi:MAG: class I SAM-dependent methyltransferase [Acidiferrobacterales bacterium]
MVKTTEKDYDIVITEGDSANFLLTWLSGLDDEIRDWIIAYEEWCETAKTKKSGESFLDRNREVQFNFLKNWQETPPKVLDVGSGAFSWIGTKSPAGEISLQACDALADVYAALSKKYNLVPYVNIDFCVVERLLDRYGSESYDYVIMNNALDHSFDAILGIKNLLGVLRIGGTLYLGHFVNEASNGNFNGIHQWDVDERNGDMVVARGNYLFNVTKYAGQFCDVVTERENGERWIGHDQYIPAERVVTKIVKRDHAPQISSQSMYIYDKMLSNIAMYMNSSVYRSIGVANETVVKLHSRQDQSKMCRKQIDEEVADRQSLQEELSNLRKELDIVYNSRSFRITSPFRKAARVLRGKLGREK